MVTINFLHTKFQFEFSLCESEMKIRKNWVYWDYYRSFVCKKIDFVLALIVRTKRKSMQRKIIICIKYWVRIFYRNTASFKNKGLLRREFIIEYKFPLQESHCGLKFRIPNMIGLAH